MTIEAILNAREERAKRQKLWLDQTRVPLVSCTMNTAGAVKDTSLIRETFSALTDDLEKALAGLPILKKELLFYPTGPECLFAVDADPMELKRRCIAVEEATPAGRLLDADVMDRNGRSISRTLLGKPERSCLVCGKPGRACAAGQVHPIEEVLSASERRMKVYLLGREPEEAADRAVRALIREVHVTPKPGLVDENNSGSHSDMDLALMEKSARSLRPYFETCVRTGLDTAAKAPEETFPPLRAAGREAERTMFAVTRGVNTHKGAIYLFGILLGAYGRLWKPGGALPIETVLTEAGRVSARAVREDLARIDATPDSEQTSGQKFYKAYGMTGARGEAAAGFPSVRKALEPLVNGTVSPETFLGNNSLVRVLLGFIAEGNDTNLIARGGLEKARRAAEQARVLLSSGPACQAAIEELDRDFIAEHLSPGGSADLLAVTIFLGETAS